MSLLSTYAGELITRVELQWDPISMRGVRFWTNLGRKWEWGYLDIPGATKATSSAPVPGAYLAAMRGFEGKPRARIAKKRYESSGHLFGNYLLIVSGVL